MEEAEEETDQEREVEIDLERENMTEPRIKRTRGLLFPSINFRYNVVLLK